MRLAVAEGEHLERILDVTYPIWNEGLNPRAYSQWNAAQLRTPWGRAHLQRLALIGDDGTSLASAKRYRFQARLRGLDGVVTGLGAVITPPDLRGRGYASALVERIVEEERAAGALFVCLFSEIGGAFYERLGFYPIPLDEVTVRVDVKNGGAPAMLVRAGDERDLPALVAMHEARSLGAPFTLRRDRALLQYALAKKRLLAGLGPPGLRQVEFFVAEEGTAAVAYVVLSENANGWTLEEAGDRDPTAARLGGMLQVLVAREPSARPPLIRAWWPRGFAVPPQLSLTDRIDSRDLFMVRPLVPESEGLTADDVFWWRSDYF